MAFNRQLRHEVRCYLRHPFFGLYRNGGSPPKLLDNNLKCVDLSDLKGPLPLEAISTKEILKQTEDWEHSTYKNPQWPKGGTGHLGIRWLPR